MTQACSKCVDTNQSWSVFCFTAHVHLTTNQCFCRRQGKWSGHLCPAISKTQLRGEHVTTKACLLLHACNSSTSDTALDVILKHCSLKIVKIPFSWSWFHLCWFACPWVAKNLVSLALLSGHVPDSDYEMNIGQAFLSVSCFLYQVP